MEKKLYELPLFSSTFISHDSQPNTQAESEHMRKETTEQIEKTRTAEQMEHERSRLLGDIATLGAERRHAEEQWRQTGAALDLNTPSRQQCMQCLHE